MPDFVQTHDAPEATSERTALASRNEIEWIVNSTMQRPPGVSIPSTATLRSAFRRRPACRQRLLQGGQRDHLTAHFEESLQPAAEVQETFSVLPHQVACHVPTMPFQFDERIGPLVSQVSAKNTPARAPRAFRGNWWAAAGRYPDRQHRRPHRRPASRRCPASRSPLGWKPQGANIP